MDSITDCEIVGIEIDDAAEPVDAENFSGPTAFIVGNEVGRHIDIAQFFLHRGPD